MIQSVKTCLSKYITFSGRASRSEYWYFALFVFVVSVLLAILDSIIMPETAADDPSPGLLNGFFQLAMFLPLLAAGWRRLHDTGRPGWYLLLPVGLNLVAIIAMLTGVIAFSALETQSANPDALRGPAAFLGASGLVIVGVVQLLLALLLLWWLTRPSDPGPNAYGDPS
ncbi:DUF805 domain-containing protein [Ruegeria atlantica]|uniref:Inner membrane protein YhaH n=1 Tax=Ruegeria atlantica TaxID=81569 RepID=A0A0P1EM55_9RHOB|nr:DUF805 domain-containing protein [Ruegeria atlantica]CUH42387.1 Inner membrane protein YhaH [Ruegeria atlantica]